MERQERELTVHSAKLAWVPYPAGWPPSRHPERRQDHRGLALCCGPVYAVIEAMRDLYADLHVPRAANRDAIHASFRTLARHWHPDFGGDHERMQAINDAWAILGRPDRRAMYDHQCEAERIARQQAAAAKATGQPIPTSKPAEASKARDANTLDYGRYEGWTIEALANHDPDYLEWLRRSPSGRAWRTRIDAALAARAMRMPPPPAPAKRRGLFGR